MCMCARLTQQPDEIVWRWTADGVYTAKSAYNIQFQGIFTTFDGRTLWKAHAEGKHKFFTWLLLHSKLLTADKLMIRNWPCNPICSLCDQEFETALHLCFNCSYAKEVWHLVFNWAHLDPSSLLPDCDDIQTWWASVIQQHNSKKQRSVAAILMMSAWNIWNERNRWVFSN